MSPKKLYFQLLPIATVILAKEPTKIAYSSPDNVTPAHFVEHFDSGLTDIWIKTTGTKQDEDASKYSGEWSVEPLKKDALDADNGLVLTTAAAHGAIAADLDDVFDFADERNQQFVVQYEVNFQDGIECGGAYVKLFADNPDLNLKSFHDKTRFSIMFGPDKCANDFKLHFILNFQNPKTGEFEEKHLEKKVGSDVLKPVYGDAAVHLYRLVLDRATNNFEIFLDNKSVSKGNLLTDLKPAIIPEKQISDDNDVKPADWDDREEIDDPNDSKPEDWDEDAPMKIPDESAKKPSDWNEELEPTIEDPEAIQPDDWDEEMDGEYEPPRIPNPECAKISGCGPCERPLKTNPNHKGKWYPKQIKNPDYQGEWKARMIDNPAYFEQTNVYNSITPIRSVALELWTMSKDIYFDNFYIGNSVDAAKKLSSETFDLKIKQANANKPSLTEKAASTVSEKPWILILIGVVVGIPVLFLIYRMCRPAAQPTEDEKMKKDDDYRPATIEEEAEEEGQNSNASGSENGEEEESEIPKSEDGRGDGETNPIEEVDDNEQEGASEKDSESDDIPEPSKPRTRRAQKAD